MADLSKYFKELTSLDWHRREITCRELGVIGDSTAVEPLIDLLDDSRAPVQQAACDALGEIGDERAVFPLVRRLDTARHLRHSICRVLGLIGDPRAFETLMKYIEDDSPSVYFAAYRSLGQLGDERALEPLIERLEYDDWHIRESVCYALGDLGDTRAVEPVIGLLDDEPRVRIAACVALGQLRGRRAIVSIMSLLNDADEDIQTLATEVLDNIDRNESVEAITDSSSSDPEPDYSMLDSLIDAMSRDKEDIKRVASEIVTLTFEIMDLDPTTSLCSYCFNYFETRFHQLAMKTKIKTCVCRTCGKTGMILPDIHEVIAVLDKKMDEDFIHLPGIVRINWLKRRKMFDINRIVIKSASKTDFKELISTLDADDFMSRPGSRKDILCTISKKCKFGSSMVDELRTLVGFVVD